jgi:hypothetical protein
MIDSLYDVHCVLVSLNDVRVLKTAAGRRCDASDWRFWYERKEPMSTTDTRKRAEHVAPSGIVVIIWAHNLMHHGNSIALAGSCPWDERYKTANSKASGKAPSMH